MCDSINFIKESSVIYICCIDFIIFTSSVEHPCSKKSPFDSFSKHILTSNLNKSSLNVSDSVQENIRREVFTMSILSPITFKYTRLNPSIKALKSSIFLLVESTYIENNKLGISV